MLGGLLPARSGAEQGRQNNHPTLGIVKPSLASMPQAFSNNEFHRRWDALRKRMKEAKLDCLIVPQHPHGSFVLDEYRTDADVNWQWSITHAYSTSQTKHIFALFFYLI